MAERAPLPAAADPSDVIIPPPPAASPADRESPDVWGFEDSGFTIDAEGVVRFRGARYDICGYPMRELVPWVRRVFEIPLDPQDTNPPNFPPTIPRPVRNNTFLEDLQRRWGGASDQTSDDAQLRLRHGHGHTQADMWAIKYGQIARVPDLIVWPQSERQVEVLVQLAKRHRVALIPYGGGTNVTQALHCPGDEKRMIVSVDMQRMNRIRWIDKENLLARIEAGAVGRDLSAQLAAYGLTLGHEPDSHEFSTLGGWVATHASGMKKNRYGNIEDIVRDVTVVGPDGVLQRRALGPRESVGVAPSDLVFGSEGALGIVTSAVVQLAPAPEVVVYDSIVFPTFEAGVQFMHDLTRSGRVPASVRLVDNLQFQLSQALKPSKTGFKKLMSRFQKWYVTGWKGFGPTDLSACTIVFEGTRDEVREQRRVAKQLAKRHRGIPSGPENGKRGYALTFAIAYIRDFVMNHWILAESFETSAPWSRIHAVCDGVKKRLAEEHTRRGLPGKPFITCRVTQVYPTGVAIYFYFAYCYKGLDNPSRVYEELEHVAREEILRQGGSLSHHHGIGKVRADLLHEVHTPAALDWTKRIKHAIDPDNIFAAGNQNLPAGTPPAAVQIGRSIDELLAPTAADEPGGRA